MSHVDACTSTDTSPPIGTRAMTPRSRAAESQGHGVMGVRRFGP